MNPSTSSRQAILSADDFGYSPHTVDWTIRCFEAGVLTSASIMVTAAAASRAVDYAKNNPQWSFALHLCLTDEWPACKPSDIPSMVAHTGRLLPTRTFLRRAALGLISSKDVERETRAQLERLYGAGVSPTHIDGHGHMHRIPIAVRALIRIAPEFGICSIRPAQTIYFPRKTYLSARVLNWWVNRVLRRHFRGPEHFVMTSGKLSSDNADWFRRLIAQLPMGVTEIGIHPGIDEEWRRIDTLQLLDSGLADLKSRGIGLTSYHRYAEGSARQVAQV